MSESNYPALTEYMSWRKGYDRDPRFRGMNHKRECQIGVLGKVKFRVSRNFRVVEITFQGLRRLAKTQILTSPSLYELPTLLSMRMGDERQR